MSDMWSRASVVAATRTGSFIRPHVDVATFTPWSRAPRRGAEHAEEAVEDPPTPEALAFAEGFEEGRRTVEAELAQEREALRKLAESLAVLKPEEPEELALLLAETVERLVRQIVGEVSFDSDILVERATRAAIIVAEQGTSAKMRLNPSDHGFLEGADLPVEMVSDPRLAPGTVLLETADGWIEDGSDVGIEKLRIALDRMGVPR